MYHATIECGPADECGTIQIDRVFREVLDVLRLGIVGGHQVALPVTQLEEAGVFRLAQMARRLKDRHNNRLNIGG